jgi:hypothetical protein
MQEDAEMLKTRIKKIVSVFLTVGLLLNGLVTSAVSDLSLDDNLRNGEISNSFEYVTSERSMFNIRTPTLDDDFKEDRVLAVLRQEHSEVNAVREVHGFNDFAQQATSMSKNLLITVRNKYEN